MKGFKIILIILCILFINNDVLASNSSVGGNTEIYAQSIKIIDSPKYIQVGKSIQLETSITPSNTTNKAVTWKSSDESILKVSKTGKITGIKKGTVKVTARTSNGRTYSIAITVLHSNTTTGGKKISSISIVDTPKEVLVGNEFQIKTSISPKNASNPNLTYKSSNNKIIRIDKTGYAKAVGKGTATITVKSSNGKSTSIKIKVKNIKIVLDKKELKLEKGKTTTITASIKAGKKYSAKKINWSTSATSIANVTKKSTNDNQFKATITAKNKGTTKLVIKIDDETKSIPITVKEVEPDYSLECPTINYVNDNMDSYSNNGKNSIIQMNLIFNKNIDHWDYYVSTNKKTGPNAQWEKKSSNNKGNKQITSNYNDAQGKIVIYSKEGTSRACYTIPFEIEQKNKRTNIAKNDNLICPKITSEKNSGNININVFPVNNKNYQYTWIYNTKDKKVTVENEWIYEMLGRSIIYFIPQTTFSSKKIFSLNTNGLSYDRSGKILVISPNGTVKECKTDSYNNIKYRTTKKIKLTNIYIEEGFKYTDSQIINTIEKLPPYYLASPKIYFFTKNTYNSKIDSNSVGISYPGDLSIYISDESPDLSFTTIHEISHTMDFMYYKFNSDSSSFQKFIIDGANGYLHTDLKDTYNSYKQKWNSGNHTILREYSYSSMSEFWADLNAYCYLGDIYCLNNFKTKRNVELNKISNLYNNQNSTWNKYKNGGI